MYCIEPVTIENKRAGRGHPSRHPERFVARSIESGEVEEILISLNKPSAVSYNLPAGTAFAECTVVPVNADFSDPVVVNRVETSEGSSANPRATSNSEMNTEFPDFPAVLQHLVDTTPVGTEEQRHRLKSILCHRRNAFSVHGELGFTSKVCHEIDTGDAPPIKQQPRPVPFFERSKGPARVHGRNAQE